MTGSRSSRWGTTSPSRVLTNDDLAQMVETNDAWIRDRVGIVTRRIADTGDRRRHGRRRRRQGAGQLRSDRRRHRPGHRGDLLRRSTAARTWPPGSPRKLGIAAPGAYDLNTACSGFCYALASADHAIRAGAARNVIVIGAEKLSDFTDWTDRSTASSSATAPARPS